MNIIINKRWIAIFINEDEIDIEEGTDILITTEDMETVVKIMTYFYENPMPWKKDVTVYRWVWENDGIWCLEFEEIKNGIYKKVTLEIQDWKLLFWLQA
jgi:hypothetical protein